MNTGKASAFAVVVFVLVAAGACSAGDGTGPPAGGDFFSGLSERDTLTDNWFALGERLNKRDVTVSLGLTQIYQLNLRGGLATGRRAGRYTGSYDLEVEFDLATLLNIPGGLLFVHAEGGWSGGLDASAIGSVLGGVNADACGDQVIDVTELYYEQAFLDGRVRLRIGKLDITGGFECHGCPVCFDGSAYANDEASQFLNAALVNNPTIPFPDKGLGMVVYAEPLEWLYAGIGAVDAQADARETGLSTAFHDEDYFFGIFEVGVVPVIPSKNGDMPGTYRIGLWYDPQGKDRHDGSGLKRDDVGFYLSFDQMVCRENADEDSTQGAGLFFRYGYAHRDVNDVGCFWSIGGQYQGLIPGRDDDVLGVGYAAGQLAPDAFDEKCESVLEIYYGAAVTPWLIVSPSIQYVWNPGGTDGVGSAVVVGVRAQMSF